MTATIRFADLPVGHPGRRLLTGRTPSCAAQADPRFSYSLFVPEDLRDDEAPLRLWVFVHGTGRRTELYLDAFAERARAERAIVMTPLFPIGIDGPNDIHNYKGIEAAGVRYDEVLLAMVAEVAERWSVDVSRFFLHGFSGGGQFAHRFAMLHPDRLTAVSVGAPGQVTLPTAALWWRGIGDLEERFGIAFDAAAFAAVPMQVVVGSLDDDSADLRAMGADRDVAGRLTQARGLTEALRALGATVRLDVVQGAGHDGAAMIGAVEEFLAEQLAAGAS
ncbi:alpha/beta hydrolase [Nocardioides sp. BYT-33-1]|uniref:alpha/beta hydrolase n=1 Tax=Nocardioides sp. BYT-33-1 TaxID=3416952 RepID=UPI003F52C4D6